MGFKKAKYQDFHLGHKSLAELQAQGRVAGKVSGRKGLGNAS